MTPTGMPIFLATAPVDMRRSFDGLARAAREQMGRDLTKERAMFLFVNRRRDLLKLLWRDATGWCLLCKRLDERVVTLPSDIPDGATSVAIDARSLAALLDGVVRRRTTTRDVVREARAAHERHVSRVNQGTVSTSTTDNLEREHA